MIQFKWDCPNSIFFDFETQSYCDLKLQGGRAYADHESTQILCLSIVDNDRLIVWIPSLRVERFSAPDDSLPEGYEGLQVECYGTQQLPRTIIELVETDRAWVAHNLSSFDYHIWKRLLPNHLPKYWMDSLFLARAAGLPGSLDRLASKVVGTGKDNSKVIVKKLWDVKYKDGEYYYPPVLPGMVAPLIRYAAVDTLLMKEIFPTFEHLSVEKDVLDAHVDVNERGVRIDNELAFRIEQVSQYGQTQAEKEIKELLYLSQVERGMSVDESRTFADEFNIRSHVQMKEWLHSYGVKITGWQRDSEGKLKETLGKNAVINAMELAAIDPRAILDRDSPFWAEGNVDPVVFQVLSLRGIALRITDSKMRKAQLRQNKDTGRVYDLFAYHQAHTGRNASVGIQVHNLPNAKKGIPLAKLLDYFDSGLWDKVNPETHYNYIKDLLPAAQSFRKRLTVDDALSGLIKPIFIPGNGYVFGIADYSAIEARGIAWLAGEESLLQMFRDGIDPYIQMAAKIYGIPIDQVTDDQRQVGKITILGCGYGMSANKFALFCAMLGIDLNKANTTAEICVEGYRKSFPKIAGYYAGVIRGAATPYRTGGVWHLYEKAARMALTEGGAYSAGRCVFRAVEGFRGTIRLIVTLPSGRELWYNHCRIEDRIPSYALTLGLEAKYKPTIVYESPTGERSMYPGKWAENCLIGDTKIITSMGVKRLDSIQPTDMIWDGERYVSHSGLINQGRKEVVSWQGLQLTANHLIHDGNSFKEVMHMDASRTNSALETGRYSAVLRYLKEVLGRKIIRSVSAHVGENANCRTVESGENKSSHVNLATEVEDVQQKPASLFPTRKSDLYGYIDTQASYPDAIMNHVKRILTMAVEVLESQIVGDMTNSHSLDIRLLLNIGRILSTIWIEKIMMGTTNPEISDVLTAWKTLITGGRTHWLLSGEKFIQYRNSVENFCRTGLAKIPTDGMSLIVEVSKKSLQSTIEVYDILNCGPNNRFAVLNDFGEEIIVHNCTQAICRDITMEAKAKMNMRGMRPVIDVHDEIIRECERTQIAIDEQCAIMSEVPPWASGFPIEVKGYLSPRYLKSALPGWETSKAIDGRVV